MKLIERRGCVTNTPNYKRGVGKISSEMLYRFNTLCAYIYNIYKCTRKEAVGKIVSAIRDIPLLYLRGCPLGGSRPRGQPSSSFITGLGLTTDVARRSSFIDFDLNSITWRLIYRL